MRYINLLDKASHVKTRKCFIYNNMIYFAVPKKLVSKAIGPGANNVKKLQQKLGKKVRIIEEPKGIEDAEKFVASVVEPVQFRSIEIKDGEMIITAGNKQNKAMLLGRNKRRLIELKKVIEDIFGLELKIV